MGLVIAIILAFKIMYKVTPILLDIQVPYSKVILLMGSLSLLGFFMDILVSEVQSIFPNIVNPEGILMLQ